MNTNATKILADRLEETSGIVDTNGQWFENGSSSLGSGLLLKLFEPCYQQTRNDTRIALDELKGIYDALSYGVQAMTQDVEQLERDICEFSRQLMP